MSSIILDDRDPLIVYSPGWQLGGLPTEYNSTTTYTDVGNVTATITFHGVSIGVYGTIGSSNSNRTTPQSEYQLDGITTSTYQPTLTPLSQRHQRFYQSPELANGKHTLIVRNLVNGSSWLFLDYFVVLTGGTTTISTSSVPLPTAVSTTTNEAVTSSNQNLYIIAGSVGGSVGFLLLLFGVLYFWRRRRKHDVNRDLGVVQSAWMDSPDAAYWSPSTSLSRAPKFARGSPHIIGTAPSGPDSRKALRHAFHPSSSAYDSYPPAPPEYKP